jgi:hypothetical protein
MEPQAQQVLPALTEQMEQLVLQERMEQMEQQALQVLPEQTEQMEQPVRKAQQVLPALMELTEQMELQVLQDQTGQLLPTILILMVLKLLSQLFLLQ